MDLGSWFSIVHMFYNMCMEKEKCIDATTLLLTALTQEKQARADQHRAILAGSSTFRVMRWVFTPRFGWRCRA